MAPAAYATSPATAGSVTGDWKSGCRDLNPGPPRPERGALTKLRYIPRASASLASRGGGHEVKDRGLGAAGEAVGGVARVAEAGGDVQPALAGAGQAAGLPQWPVHGGRRRCSARR